MINYAQDLDLEVFQRQALLLLYQNFNSNISNSETAWISDDISYFAQIGRPNPNFTYELVDDSNFYPGVVPSLMDAVAGLIPLDLDNYPNICTFCHRALPTNSTDDTAEIYNNLLSVEIMVKSELSELECNARIQKFVNTVHKTILDDRSFNNSILKTNVPSVTMGDIFKRLDPRDKNKAAYFQGASLEYVIQKYVDFGE